MQKSKKLDYIDATKSLAILMIMMGHITEVANPLDEWMSSCKICAFYFISGFLLAYTDGFRKRTPMEFIKNISANFAWPYLTFSVIAIIAKWFFSLSKHEDAVQVFKDNLRAVLFFKGINSMWFLPTLFIGELIALLLFMSPKIIRVLYGMGGLFGLKCAGITKSFIGSAGLSEIWTENLGFFVDMMGKSIVAAWFIGAGYVFFLMMKKTGMTERYVKEKLALGLVFTLSNIVLSQHNGKVDFNMMSMGNRPYLFIYGGVFGTIGLIYLFEVLSQYVSMDKFNYWGRNSLIIMCVHVALGFRKLAYKGWAKVASIPEEPLWEYLAQCFMVLLILMLIMYAVIELINKYAPFLIKYKKRREFQ